MASAIKARVTGALTSDTLNVDFNTFQNLSFHIPTRNWKAVADVGDFDYKWADDNKNALGPP